MNKKPVILVIDDEEAILKTLQEVLEDEGYIVQTVADASKAIAVIGKFIPDLIFLDIFMPNINGLDLLERIKKEFPQQKVIIISGFGNIPMALQAVSKGAVDFIEKPLNLDDILSKVADLKQNSSDLDSEINYEHDYENYGIVGKSFLFQELMYHVRKIEALNLPLLIYGPHGSGKSLIASYVHRKNLKTCELSSARFIEINCAGEPDFGLLDSYIIDTSSKTLYFKNIQALSLEHQKKILSLIEQCDFNVVKIIASSTASLFDLVRKERFSSALFHKLNMIPVEIPSLCKRRFDIPLLINYFVNIENGLQAKSVIFSNSSVRLMRNYTWLGNVAQLRSCIKKIVCLAPEGDFVVMPDVLRKYLGEKDTQFIDEQVFITFNTLQDATKAFEKNFLLYHLKNSHYDLGQVCERLNLEVPQLRAKLLALNIDINKAK
ncbi:MAG: response regulator [bacterium]